MTALNWFDLQPDVFCSALSSRSVAEALTQLDGQHLLLTGASGFFGKWLLALVARLQYQGVALRVTAVTRNPGALFVQHPEFTDCDWLTWVRSDVRELARCELADVDLVIHAATDTSASGQRDSLNLLDCMINGTEQVLRVAVARGAKRVLLTGSGAQYGRLEDGCKVREDSNSACATTGAGSAYAEGKRYQETLAAAYAQHHQLEVINTRCFAFAGAGLTLDGHFAFGNFVRDALTSSDNIVLNSTGASVRSYMHGADLAVWLLVLLVQGESGQAYNVGSDEGISIVELARQIAGRLAPHKRVLIADGASAAYSYYVPDTAKAQQLGLHLWHGIDSCIDSTAQWAHSLSHVPVITVQ